MNRLRGPLLLVVAALLGLIPPAAVRGQVLCEGEYGLKNVVVGVPVKIGRGGAEQILEYELTGDERAALETSASAVRELCRTVDRLMI